MDKNRTNFGGFSSALFRENFKQHWYVPALLFILYFLSGIFPVWGFRESKEAIS